MKGIIACDIDGTLIADESEVPDQIIKFLEKLHKQGWILAFITGRNMSYTLELFSCIQFPYFAAAQNGSVILKMPEQSMLSRIDLELNLLSKLYQINSKKGSESVIYSGFMNGDESYWRPKSFSPRLRAYLLERSNAYKETWTEIETFEKYPFDSFAAAKWFGDREELEVIIQSIYKLHQLNVPLIKDPFRDGYYIAQVTNQTANKGAALQKICRSISNSGTVIAVGDDSNDKKMLEGADIRVVMNTAPQDLLEIADIVAPSAKEYGIIDGLSRAIELRLNHD